MRYNFKQPSQKLFRFAIALIFIYFGYLAIADPITAGNRFIAPWALDILVNFADFKIFMTAFGIVQIAVGLAIIFKILLKYSLILAALLLIGIIINLGVYIPGTGINELALRDFVILTGIIYLYFSIGKHY